MISRGKMIGGKNDPRGKMNAGGKMIQEMGK